MLILKILGSVALLFILYLLAVKINEFTAKRHGYLFLNKTTLTTSLSGYVSCFFGYTWYMDALQKHGDILNGEILMAVGVGLLLWTLYSNIKNTDIVVGFLFRFVQQALYLVAGAVGLVILLLMFAMFAEAKPVYRID